MLWMKMFFVLVLALGCSCELSQVEQTIIDSVEPMRIRAQLESLTQTSHVFGTPQSEAVAKLIAQQWTDTGFFDSVKLQQFTALAYYPKNISVEVLSPKYSKLSVEEPDGPGVELKTAFPLFSGYSASGIKEARIIYANYCRLEDFEYLRDILGVQVKGAITLCRYGAVFRGLKGRYSEQFGAVGALIYSDPLDDGFYQGVQYPDGPGRPPLGGQRGSVMYLPWCPGNPSKARIDGVCGLKGQPVSTTLPAIPIQPLSWQEAEVILRQLTGTPVLAADGWQGGLSFHYHIGDGAQEVRVRLNVEMDEADRTGWNVIAKKNGEDESKRVIVGCHHDAWVAGAKDPLSGIVAMTEAALLLKAASNVTGFKLSRSLEFAAWDAEEWALIGSTDYVESSADELLKEAVYYLNLDGVVGSVFPDTAFFSAQTSAVLNSAIRAAAAKVPDYVSNNKTLADRIRPGPFGLLGSGSDYVAFVQRLGVSGASFGFSNRATPSNYHSKYDSFYQVDKITDPTFELHGMAAQFSAIMLYDIASPEPLASDVNNLAEELKRYKSMIEASEYQVSLDWTTYDAAQMQFARTASRVGLDARTEKENDVLMRLERDAFILGAEGLPTRPWYKNVLYAASLLDGYAAQVLPGVAYYARAADEALANQQLQLVVQAIERATLLLNTGFPERLTSDALAGIIAGSILVVALLITIIVCLIARSRRNKYSEI